jgi:hypothetical protein
MKENWMVSAIIEDVKIPKMFKIEQEFENQHICPEAIGSHIESLLTQEAFSKTIKEGMRIGITAGSRGIRNVVLITRSIVEFVQAKGAKPYILAAMGSHGGSTSEGQRAILEGLGITEQSMGCPILSDMAVVLIGKHEEGGEVYLSRDAMGMDGIIVSCRIKPHTCFRGPYESGIMKMMTIGLGKQKGADTCHKAGFGLMDKNIPLYGKAILENAPILFAVAVVENAFEDTYDIFAVEKELIVEKEPEYQQLSKTLLPRIPFGKCDVLVCDTIGKNFSGSGMDSNITGTYPTPFVEGIEGSISPQRVAVLDLSEESHHNGCGCGMAHATTQRFFKKMDFEQTYPNVLTSTVIENVRIPMVLKNDREALQVCIKTSCNVGEEGIRIIRIMNTTHINRMYVSQAYYEEIKDNPKLKILCEPQEAQFTEEGAFIDLGNF